ncbi:hypothetical protein BS47DRAFT_1343711, partial [Hydnum rufescens UP504]
TTGRRRPPSRCNTPKPIFHLDNAACSPRKSACSRPELARPIFLESTRVPLPPPRGHEHYPMVGPRANYECNWEEEEGSSSDDDQVFCSDDGSDDEPDSDDWLFAPGPSRIPRTRRCVPLMTTATVARLRRRASFQEAHKRRFGLLFPLESDSMEERQALRHGGKLARYHDLVVPKPIAPASIKRKQKAQAKRHVLAAPSRSPVVVSPSRISSTSSFHSSPPSELFESSSASSVSTAPSSTRPPSCIKPSRLIPVPESECPLFQLSLTLKLEAESSIQQERDRVAQAEEEAFQAASQLASLYINTKKAALRARRRRIAERTLLEKLSFPSSVLTQSLKTRFFDLTGGYASPSSPPEHHSPKPFFTAMPMRPYGARATSSAVAHAFPEVHHPALSSETYRTIVELETYIHRPRVKPLASFLRPRMACRESQSRSRSRGRYSSGHWGDEDDEDDLYGRPVVDDDEDEEDLDDVEGAGDYGHEDEDEDDDHLPIQRVPGSQQPQHRHRHIVLQDSQFFRVYAVEMATRVKYAGCSPHLIMSAYGRWHSDAFFRVAKHKKELCVACGGVGLERWRKRRVGSTLRVECTPT